MTYCAACGAARSCGADFCGACGTAHTPFAPAVRQPNVERIEPRLRIKKLPPFMRQALLSEEQVLVSCWANRSGWMRHPLVLTTSRLVWGSGVSRTTSTPLVTITAVSGTVTTLHVTAAGVSHEFKGMQRDDVRFIQQIIAGIQAGRHYVGI